MIKWYLLVAASSFVAGVWFGYKQLAGYVDLLVEKFVILDGKLDSRLDRLAAKILRLKDKL